MSGQASFQEFSAQPKTAATPLSHLSIELGHLYMDDYAAGPARLREQFERVAPWAATAEAMCAKALPGRTPRISTCFMIDDYFTKFSTPDQVIADLLDAAKATDIRIDYIAREAGCAKAGSVSPAELVKARLVDDPPPGTNGSRPPVRETGWLCNGERSPTGTGQAMGPAVQWAPPRENAINRHSIFIDVELWDTADDVVTWSCPFLAAVWQLLRLGLLRDKGAVVAAPQRWTPGEGASWDELPAVIQLEPRAHPFSAYRTFSVLDTRFFHIEHAVRTILGQVAVERTVAEMVAKRAVGEKLAFPAAVVDRMEYVFSAPAWRA